MREQATVTLHKLLSGKIYIHPVGFKKHLFTFKNKFFKEKKNSIPKQLSTFHSKIPFMIMVLKMLCLAEQNLLHVPPTTYNVNI